MDLNPVSWPGARSSAPVPATPRERVPSSRLWVLGSWGWLWGKAALALVSSCLGDEPGFLAWIFLRTEELCLDRARLCSYGTRHRMTATFLSAQLLADISSWKGGRPLKDFCFSSVFPVLKTTGLVYFWFGAGQEEERTKTPHQKGGPRPVVPGGHGLVGSKSTARTVGIAHPHVGPRSQHLQQIMAINYI